MTIALLRTLGLLMALAPGMSDPPTPGGVVVESVRPGSQGETAGLQPGDTIVSWSCAAAPPLFPDPSSGLVRSPYDLLPLEIEQAPRRPVTLRGHRGGQDMVWSLSSGEWRIQVSPVLTDDLAALFLAGKTKSAASDFAAAEQSWRSAAALARGAGDERLAAWFLDWLASTLARAGKWPESDAAFGEVLKSLEHQSEHAAAAHLLRAWGTSFETRGDLGSAVERYRKALALDGRSLAAARSLNSLGVAAAKGGDYPQAEALLQEALAIREKLAPGTVEVTGSLTNLGILARRRGDLAAAEAYLTRGEELQRRIAPYSIDRALFFQNLGNVARERGDLEKAASQYRQGLALFEKTAPGSENVMACLERLGEIAMLRGDLAAADELLRRSLALQEESPVEEQRLSTPILLGHVAARRGDLEAAETQYRRAWGLLEKVAPNGPDAPYILGSLGDVALERGDVRAGRAYLERALAVEERLAPGSVEVGTSLELLARAELLGGDLTKAQALLQRALTIFEKEAPDSLETSGILSRLGEVAARRELWEEAKALHRRALELRRRLAPETTAEAESLHLLGRAEQRAGRSDEGVRNLCRAIDVLDRQRAKLGGTQEAKLSFEASIGDYYFACLEGLIQLGRPAEAFYALERGRARSFLHLLADRDLRLSGLPPELAAERRRLDAGYDRVQSELAHLSNGRDDAEITRLTGELRDLRARQEEAFARLRRDSPRSAALENPEPLDLPRTRAALDPGTVLLEYAVGPEKTWLFVVQAADAGGPGLAVLPIAAGATALREKVEAFRRLMKEPTSSRAELQSLARQLYGLLVHPAENETAQAQRILISPDGPLHTLPFAVLMQGDRYLVERKPIHFALSATVYADLRRSRPAQRRPEEQRLVAFGDPLYPGTPPEKAPDPELREAVRRGLSLKPLPSSRMEVEAIAALFPQPQVFLGRQASEENAKSIKPEARLVHFACHGLLDERFPLNSALALSLPDQPKEGGDNGLLQAWEIFESVRLDADLVTLSACDTALGREMGGEGLVGLTRAFQFAGARTVLASLWSVSDASTARLMTRFYGYLRSGKPKDEALQAAQIEQLRERSGSAHPFHWAAFQLAGDWR